MGVWIKGRYVESTDVHGNPIKEKRRRNLGKKYRTTRRKIEKFAEGLPKGNAFTGGFESPRRSAPKRRAPAKKYIVHKGKIYKAVETQKKKKLKKKKEYYHDPWSFM